MSWLRGRALRAGRAMALGAAAYGAGRAHGASEALEDPAAYQLAAVRAALRQQAGAGGAGAREPARILDGGHPAARRAARVGARVVAAAGRLAREARQLPVAQRQQEEAGALGSVRCEAIKALAEPRGQLQVAVFDHPAPNAFALMAVRNVVFVSSGLVEALEDDAELAFVVAHEIGHVLQNHTEDSAFNVGIAAIAQLGFIAAVDPTGGFASEAALLAMAAGAAQLGLQLPASRAHEYEADALGLRLASAACFPPERAMRGLASIHRAVPGGTVGGVLYDHPETRERLSKLEHGVLAAARKDFAASGCAPVRNMLRASLFGLGER